MSIIIKGIDLPKEDEVLSLEINHKGEMRVFSTELRELNKDPIAIQIPTPHGRLIDGDALDQYIEGKGFVIGYKAIDEQKVILDEERE